MVVDLSNEKGGDNTAPTALELAVMSLAGCATTIFSGVAPQRHLPFAKIDVSVEADQPEGARTITMVRGIVDVYTDQSEADVKTAFDITKQECPVGVLFEDAGVKMDWTLNVRRS